MREKIKQIKYPVPGRPSLAGSEVNVKGWVRTVRNQKTFSFVEINDGSTLSNFQIVVNADLPKYDRIIADLSTGVSISATGTLAESPSKQQQQLELHATKIEII